MQSDWSDPLTDDRLQFARFTHSLCLHNIICGSLHCSYRILLFKVIQFGLTSRCNAQLSGQLAVWQHLLSARGVPTRRTPTVVPQPRCMEGLRLPVRPRHSQTLASRHHCHLRVGGHPASSSLQQESVPPYYGKSLQRRSLDSCPGFGHPGGKGPNTTGGTYTNVARKDAKRPHFLVGIKRTPCSFYLPRSKYGVHGGRSRVYIKSYVTKRHNLKTHRQ